IIPRNLVDKEIAHRGLSELKIVDSMHQRKALMSEVSDAFIAMPGGYGTFEELFEIITWEQLGIHTKPIGLLDVAGYFEPLLALIAHAVAEGFIPAQHSNIVIHESSPAVLLDRLAIHQPDITKNLWSELPPDR
ncbi:MAG TPA: TIGR00730 family Rossman fold protein, partial [Ktedonobacteraceae bacterium]